MSDDRYAQHDWKWADEYPDLYENDATCALWYRLMRLADMAWPSAATLPIGTKRKALDALVASGLVLVVTPSTYKIRGMDKRRAARSQSASHAARSRWSDAARNAGGNAPRNAEVMPSKAKQSKAEQSRADVPAALPTADEADPIETYYQLTAKPPSKTVIDWLDRLAREHGASEVGRTMAVVWGEDATPNTFLGRVEATLTIDARRSSHEAEEARRKADEERQRLERERIESMSDEEREAVRQKFRAEVSKHPAFAHLAEQVP